MSITSLSCFTLLNDVQCVDSIPLSCNDRVFCVSDRPQENSQADEFVVSQLGKRWNPLQQLQELLQLLHTFTYSDRRTIRGWSTRYCCRKHTVHVDAEVISHAGYQLQHVKVHVSGLPAGLPFACRRKYLESVTMTLRHDKASLLRAALADLILFSFRLAVRKGMTLCVRPVCLRMLLTVLQLKRLPRSCFVLAAM